MQHLLKMTSWKLQYAGGKDRSNMAAFELFGWGFSFWGGQTRGICLFGELFGVFYHNIFLHSSEMKDNALDTTKWQNKHTGYFNNSLPYLQPYN